jgi:hypothetical protein
MQRKGYNFKRAPHLAFRDIIPDFDGDKLRSDWRKAPKDYRSGYSVVVSLKAVWKVLGLKTWENAEWEEYSEAIKKVPCLPFTGWSRTNMIYGIWRKRNQPVSIDHGDGTCHWQEHYWTRTVYWIEDAQVFTATDRCYDEKKPRA